MSSFNPAQYVADFERYLESDDFREFADHEDAAHNAANWWSELESSDIFDLYLELRDDMNEYRLINSCIQAGHRTIDGIMQYGIYEYFYELACRAALELEIEIEVT